MRFVLVAKLRSYLGLHDEAIAALTRGLDAHPDDAVLLRHRGEFLMTVRRYAEAVADLERATEALTTVPDAIDPYRSHLLPEIDRLLLGEPPRLIDAPLPVDPATVATFAGSYVGTLASSTWYHLALTRYLQGDDAGADRDFAATERVAVFADTRAAVANWRYLTLRRLGARDRAQAVLAAWSADQATAEPSYAHNLAVYRGAAPAVVPAAGPLRARVTQGYGAAAWLLAEDRQSEAVDALRAVVALGDTTAFGHLAALEDLGRLGPNERAAPG
jgi:tetratricopeptide (TPR) repeat protein